jgi:uncharacterized integral membrane protein
MVVKYVFIALLAAAIAVFALQNNAPTAVRFLLWAREGTPLATVILLSVAAGIVLVGLPLWVDRWRLRSRVRALEEQLATLAIHPGERQRFPGSSAE